ncbi:MAG: ATP-binding protein [Ahrensia sp.]|nr:ATP-binding protein [Ahrensia sp.]
MTLGKSDLRSLLGAAEDPMLLVDRNWSIVEANDAAEELFGHELPGQPLVRALRNPDAIRALSSVLDRGGRAKAEITLSNPDPIPFRLRVASLSGVEAGEAAAVIVLRDISPWQAAQQMRSDFVANVSHELRSPLTTLAGLIETLRTTASDDPEAQARFLGIMSREAARMDRLIGDLLSLSRVEADERIRPTDPVDLIATIRNVLTIIAERAEASDRTLSFEPDLEACLVAGDSDQLTQVFQNLLENAVRYSRQGGSVHISIERRKPMPKFATEVWAISISDEGEGIAPEHIPRLTERFYRVDSGRSRQMGGTGLGLAIVKHIVNRHRGRLVITSRQGVGTTMTVLLPVLD